MELTETKYKQTEVGLIPEDWKLDTINNIMKSIVRGPFGGALKKEFFVKDGYKVYEQRNAIYQDIHLGNYYINRKKFEELKRFSISEGDFIVSCSGTIGKIYRIPEKFQIGVINQALLKLSINEDKVSSLFFYYQFIDNNFQNRVIEDQGGAMKNLVGMPQFKSSLFILPELREQKAIATVLSDTDALIQALEKKIAKKKLIKKGVMQKLLTPKEGWEEKQIQDISIVGRGRVISHKEIEKSTKNMYPVYSSQTRNNGVMGFLDQYDFEGEYITWTTDGENAGTVFYRDGKFNCTNVCGTIKLNVGFPRFVAYILDTIAPKHVSRNLANPKLMNDPMKKIIVPFPDYDEQVKIANIISDMESEIEVLEQKLSKYQLAKQGMMQQLLTGKIRLV